MDALSRVRLYQSVPTIDPDFGGDGGPGSEKPLSNREARWSPSCRAICIYSVVLWAGILIFAFGHQVGYQEADRLQGHAGVGASASDDSCMRPKYRREWRSLSHEEKSSYVDAVNCLARSPSVLRDNGTLFDDFPWVHYQMSQMIHGTPAFLTWHRRFSWIYEKYLQDLCDYKGALPYWDWTLDWEHPPGSPIFSPTTGFGGDGDPSARESVGDGHCVTEGPFANLKPLFYGAYDKPHCFSRGFIANFSTAHDISPAVIEDIMDSVDYETFFKAMVNGPHNTIPNGVRGDFWSFTAPYDPLHFLHHAQLDRLWYHWQHRGAGARLTEYSGKVEGTTGAAVSLDDVLLMGGLDEDVRVSQVMNTQGGGMCYQYAY